MGYANLTVLLEEYRISPVESLASVCDLDTNYYLPVMLFNWQNAINKQSMN